MKSLFEVLGFCQGNKRQGRLLLAVSLILWSVLAACGAGPNPKTAAYSPLGEPEEGLYMVIDLSEGPDATNYPVTYLDAMPVGGWSDEYKTDKLVMRKIPSGTFIIGSPEGELGRFDDEKQYPITLTHDFYIGVFEVTQRQWELVMENRPSNFNNNDHYQTRPVEQVSYYDIRENPDNSPITPNWPQSEQVHADSFMGRLREKTALATFDLPTEAQWEYACRAGTTTALNSGKNLTDGYECPNMSEVGRYWYNGGSDSSQDSTPLEGTALAGSYLPNVWGLYDMHGNVYEWCLDWYGERTSNTEDPDGAWGGLFRLLRGGGTGRPANYCRSAIRDVGVPGIRDRLAGFRVAVTLPISLYDLTVLNGSGGGAYAAGTQIIVEADAAPAGQVFRGWTVSPEEADLGTLFDADSSSTTVTMPAQDVTMTAHFGFPPEEGLYMVVDLSDGPDAADYPVTYLDTVPLGGWSDEYKTDKLVMRKITAGSFAMGSPDNELGRFNHETQHPVTQSRDFYMGVFEVTQRQWELVMGNRPSYFNNNDHYPMRPVEQVSYCDIRENPDSSEITPNWPKSRQVHADSFMGRLRAKTGLSTFDLPTEGQWEYACRAGTTTSLNSAKNLTDNEECPNMSEVGRYQYNGGLGSSQGSTPSAGTALAGSYLPNAWGLYDMHGNVFEWCLDWYGTYPGSVNDPAGMASGSDRIARGGCWSFNARRCRSAHRYFGSPARRINNTGFRVAMSLPTSEAAVYRFWSPRYNGHFFTISEGEKDHIIANLQHDWSYEGIAYYAFNEPVLGAVPLYRFWSGRYNGHFFTISENEKDHIKANLQRDWSYEGIAYYVYPADGESRTAVHRFWSDRYKHHFYTTSVGERDNIIANLQRDWTYEGIAYYVPLVGTTTQSAAASSDNFPELAHVVGAMERVDIVFAADDAMALPVAGEQYHVSGSTSAMAAAVTEVLQDGTTFPLHYCTAPLVVTLHNDLTGEERLLLDGVAAAGVTVSDINPEQNYWLEVALSDQADCASVALHRSSFVRQVAQPDALDVDLLTATTTAGTGVGAPVERIIVPSVVGSLTVEFYSATLGVIETLEDVSGGEVLEFTLPEWNCWYRIAAWQEDGTPVLSLWLRHQVE